MDSLLSVNLPLNTTQTPGHNKISSAQNAEAVANEFEAVFVSLLMKEMRATLQEGGFFGKESSDSYGSMFDLFIGKQVADSRPLGVADMVVEHYRRNAKPIDLQQISDTI